MKKIILIMTVMSVIHVFNLPACRAQENIVFLDDTVIVGEVTVVPLKPDGESGYKVTGIDKDLLNSLAANSLADILNLSTPLYIKSYGEGGAASSSFRGMGASHTQVLWEGLRIDNPMTGQTDLSTLFTYFIDDIELYNGGTPMSFGNRGAGGTVSLKSEPGWDKGVGAEYKQLVGSFSNFTENIDFSVSNKFLSYSLRAYHQKSKNNYRYRSLYDSGDILERIGAGYMSRGLLQEFSYKTANLLIGTKIWYNKSDRELPGSIEYPTLEGNEKQIDESIRGILSFTSYSDRGQIEGKIAYYSDWLHYENEMYFLDSRNQVKSLNGRLNGLIKFSENSKLSYGLDLRTTAVHTNNYDDDIRRKQAALELSYNLLPVEWLGLYASINQEMLNKELLRISPSAGFDLRLLGSRDYHIKGSIGLSSHLPTLNDLYWVPGGNPDLKTEKATNYETTLALRERILKRILFEGSITAYQSDITDLIQWVPVSEFLWTPENVSKVLSRGVELDQIFTYTAANQTFKLLGTYYYTEVSSQNSAYDGDLAVGKQLIYVPKNKVSISLVYRNKGFLLSWNSLYTGKRYVSGDNTESLPSFWLSNASIQGSVYFKSLELNPAFIVNNIFNTDYQSVKNYPMPWRSYQLSVSIKFLQGKR